jgi:hypothetical protein
VVAVIAGIDACFASLRFGQSANWIASLRYGLSRDDAAQISVDLTPLTRRYRGDLSHQGRGD